MAAAAWQRLTFMLSPAEHGICHWLFVPGARLKQWKNLPESLQILPHLNDESIIAKTKSR
jgi:hypothetical protein